MLRVAGTVLVIAGFAACGSGRSDDDPIFIDGRPVAATADSLLGMTRSGFAGLIVRNRNSGHLDTLGLGVLQEPLQVQGAGGRWYIIEPAGGRPVVRVLSHAGTEEDQVPLDSATGAPQFAVLPDGRLVVEGRGGRLLAVHPDSITTFAETSGGPKPGLLTAADGGVLYALPDRSITLYNAFGNPRWRVDWPWHESAYVAAVAVDRNGRMHFLSGSPADSTFRIFTLSGATGEVLRWSEPGPSATFVVDHLGTILPDSADRWTGGK